MNSPEYCTMKIDEDTAHFRNVILAILMGAIMCGVVVFIVRMSKLPIQ